MGAREEFFSQWERARKGAQAADDVIIQPYPGLRSFWQTETDLFFGRGRQIKELLQGLDSRKVTFVLGGSGSGKSSLVRAGLIPRLSTAPVRPRVGAWYPVEFRPGEAPSDLLLDALIKQLIDPILTEDNPDENQRILRRRALSETFGIAQDLSAMEAGAVRNLCRDCLRQLLFRGDVIDPEAVIGLAENELATLDGLLSGVGKSVRPSLFILIDQFEEVFGEEVPRADQRMLISLITEVWKKRPACLYIAVTLRSEELHRCSEFEGLTEVINASLYLVDLVREVDLTEVIIGPARRVLKSWGLEDDAWSPDNEGPFTSDAIATLRKTYRDSARTASSADRLPLIQHLLTLVWDRAIRRWQERPKSKFLQIDVNDIQAVPGWLDRDGPLRGPLTDKADIVLSEAIAAIGRSPATRTLDAEPLLQAAFCMLARQDDRGNPKRDFATKDEMLRSSGIADRERRVRSTDEACRIALDTGLDCFRRAGLIDVFREGTQQKYNVNHEAFIRGWRQYGTWLLHARQCEDRLIDIDEKLQQRENARETPDNPIAGMFNAAVSFLFASRLSWAALVVTEDTARLLEDVIGPNSTFSWSWAKKVLARKDVDQPLLAPRTR